MKNESVEVESKTPDWESGDLRKFRDMRAIHVLDSETEGVEPASAEEVNFTPQDFPEESNPVLILRQNNKPLGYLIYCLTDRLQGPTEQMSLYISYANFAKETRDMAIETLVPKLKEAAQQNDANCIAWNAGSFVMTSIRKKHAGLNHKDSQKHLIPVEQFDAETVRSAILDAEAYAAQFNSRKKAA